MIEVTTALEIVLSHTSPLPTEKLLLRFACGRVLAESVASDIDSPPYTKSVMDGYAVRSADCAEPVSLTVIEEVAAGRVPTKVVGPGQATRIMTGAPIPQGADAVVPHEETELAGDTVRVRCVVKTGEFILMRGREMRAGEIVVPAGTALTSQVIGLLASVGRDFALVCKAPHITILATGDELVEAHESVGPGQIRNSNGPMLRAQAESCSAVSEYLLGIARDNHASLTERISEGLESSHVLILAGGVSAGKFDLVPEVLASLGVTAHFHKVRLKPGKPMLFGTRGSQLVFGLPGNPVSSFVGFELFIRPALRKMMGYATPGPTFVPVPLAAEFATKNDRPTYVPAQIEKTDALRVRARTSFGSADLRGLLGADALVSVPPGAVEYAAGDVVPTLML
ncbi:MAG TPA: gephyrin-like molybdotransferase Glp [Gemmataceae bacterium]|jgi:molybdopterin molybdotransferase|nr:gephyrin-like molybdotransferase Glp [Gemmataceae bacterium]